MRFFLVLLFAGTVSLRADIIGQSSIFVSCTLDTQTVAGHMGSCSIPVPIVGQGISIGADANAAANALPWTIGVDAGNTSTVPPGYTWSAMASALDTGAFSSQGPVRTGLVQFDIVFGEEHDDSGFSASLVSGTNNYLFTPGGVGPISPISCRIGFCEFTGELPVVLGASASPLRVSLSGQASQDSSFGGCGTGCPSGNASIDFSVFEADGTTPVSLSAYAPEPAAYGLLGFGLAALAAVSRKRRR